MRPAGPWLRPALLALALSLCACPKDKCDDFEPHCEGNVVMDCLYGVDQLVGSGQPVVYPCEEPAPLCVQSRTPVRSPDQQEFFCARGPLTPCDEAYLPSCEGTLLVSCRGGYVTAQDCTNLSGTGRCGRRTPDGPAQCL